MQLYGMREKIRMTLPVTTSLEDKRIFLGLKLSKIHYGKYILCFQGLSL